MRLSFVFSCCLCAALARADDNPATILHQIRLTVNEAVSRSDNYICAQDLSRFYYTTQKSPLACRQPPAVPAVPLRLSDRLKLDVAVSQGTEIYSWHGAQKFSASTVADIVREGPISSGSFSGYLRNIFGDRRVIFTYKSRSAQGGLSLYNFDYQVPLAASHYQLQAGKQFLLTPFHGSFSANSSTYQLYSLTVTADGDQISPKSNICAAESRLTYQLVNIADHESLLPASFDLLVGSHTGIFTESKGKFTECHQYSGESTVHFDLDDPSTPTAAAPELDTEPLRSGLLLQIALRGVLDEDQIYAGLPVEAVLVRDAKIKKGETLLRGATLKGTLTGFRVFHQPAHQVILKIEFDTVVSGAKLYLCHAVHNVDPQYQSGFAGGGRRRGAMPVAASDQSDADGSLTFNTAHLHLDRSFTSTFITVSQSDGEER